MCCHKKPRCKKRLPLDAILFAVTTYCLYIPAAIATSHVACLSVVRKNYATLYSLNYFIYIYISVILSLLIASILYESEAKMDLSN